MYEVVEIKEFLARGDTARWRGCPTSSVRLSRKERAAGRPRSHVVGCAPRTERATTLVVCRGARGIRTIGLLGTRQVMGSSLYGQLKRTQAIAPVDTAPLNSEAVLAR